MFAIKAAIRDLRAKSFVFNAQKTMYGGKRIARGDAIFIFASENEGGPGLIARGVVTSAKATPRKPGIERQTPRVSIAVKRTALAKKRVGRSELKPFSNWNDGCPETELNFKFYRQATNKIVGISEGTAVFWADFFNAGYSPAMNKRTGLIAAFLVSLLLSPMVRAGDLDAWNAAKLMGVGANIGNTLENTTTWETGWGNPRITKEFVQNLARLGFKTVRVPVAWDTYARKGRIAEDKLARVGEVVDWITAAGMFCVVNIHWDGGWIDSSAKKRFPKTFATFSPEAESKYVSYWTQISSYFAGRNEQLIFEALNEETKFEGAGSSQKAYATLTHVNQLFIDTVRKTGGNNAKRLLIVTGYATDITKTTSSEYVLPKDTAPNRLLISVHYYTPWQFAGMTKNESWGKVAPTWGSDADVAELNRLFDAMQDFCKRNDLPAFIGEFGVTDKKETPSRVRWMTAVAQAALSRQMIPVLWDIGGDLSRKPPYAPSAALNEVLRKLAIGAP